MSPRPSTYRHDTSYPLHSGFNSPLIPCTLVSKGLALWLLYSCTLVAFSLLIPCTLVAHTNNLQINKKTWTKTTQLKIYKKINHTMYKRKYSIRARSSTSPHPTILNHSQNLGHDCRKKRPVAKFACLITKKPVNVLFSMAKLSAPNRRATT